jgi:hypothetical protein
MLFIEEETKLKQEKGADTFNQISMFCLEKQAKLDEEAKKKRKFFYRSVI